MAPEPARNRFIREVRTRLVTSRLVTSRLVTSRLVRRRSPESSTHATRIIKHAALKLTYSKYVSPDKRTVDSNVREIS